MLSPEEAKHLVLEHTPLKAPRRVGLEASLGFVLQETIHATCAVPAFDNSAMDGYAVLASDLAQASEATPVGLEKIDYLPAGHQGLQPIQSGQCFQIATGAELPLGADSVVMKEHVTVEDNQIWFQRVPQKAQHVRFKGEDIQENQAILSPGTRIGPSQIALLAAFGYSQVWIHPPLEVVVMATGNELVEVDQPLESGKIRDTNSPMLAALVQEEGCQCHRVGIVRDEPNLLREALQAHLNADLVLISGGVSVGERDFVKEVLQEVGVEEIFWKVRIKPGKPFFFGKRKNSLVFGMPGNPASSYVVFEEFARPAIRKAMGHKTLEKSRVTALLDLPLHAPSPRRQYVRAQLRHEQEKFWVKPLPLQGSHSLSSLAGANALIVVPENSGELGAGASVAVKPLVDLLELEG